MSEIFVDAGEGVYLCREMGLLGRPLNDAISAITAAKKGAKFAIWVDSGNKIHLQALTYGALAPTMTEVRLFGKIEIELGKPTGAQETTLSYSGANLSALINALGASTSELGDTLMRLETASALHDDLDRWAEQDPDDRHPPYDPRV